MAEGNELSPEQIKQILDASRQMVEATNDDDFSTVPIMVRRGDTLEHNRTGVLLAVAETHFILTAAHYLDLEAANGSALYVSPSKPGDPPIPIGGRLIGAEAKVDLAILELERAAIEQLKTARRFLRITDLALEAIPAKGLYVVRGYPGDFAKFDYTTYAARLQHLRYTAQLYDGELPGIFDAPYDPKIHLLLGHTRRGYNAKSEATKAPEIAGMSGGGIWRLCAFGDGGFKNWRPEHRRLVAIQTRCKPDSYFKGTWVTYALELIAMNYPGLRQVMQRLYV